MSVKVDPYYARINAIGAISLACATLIAGMYLLISIAKQGHGKLRVRLLLGMVASDLVLGAIVLPPEIAYITGRPFMTDTATCNAMGFLLTTALFTQHLWTLAIAIATFSLLKYPLSRATRYLDGYSWACWPFIWGVSALHSGLWMRRYGFASSGTLCYYKSMPDRRPDPSLLVQFIPRAFVFITIIVLYSMLYNFLRRPDTINVSSHYTMGADGELTMEQDPTPAGAMGIEAQGAPGERSRNGSGSGDARRAPSSKRPSLLPRSWRFSKDSVSGMLGHGDRDRDKGKDEGKEMQALEPWEQVSFVNIGGKNGLQGILVSRPPSPVRGSTPDPLERADSDDTAQTDLDKLDLNMSIHLDNDTDADLSKPLPLGSVRGHSVSTMNSAATTLTTLPLLSASGRSHSSSHAHTPLQTVQSHPYPDLDSDVGEARRRADDEEAELDGSGAVPNFMDDRQRERQNSQSLAAFFQEYQISTDERMEGKDGPKARKGKSGQPMSAAQYFNRQASLLMLYFPIAYLVVFSVSLIRLIYAMVVPGTPNQVLLIVSTWLVLSVGFMDGLVYGMAEFVVKRRVRRKMPDRM